VCFLCVFFGRSYTSIIIFSTGGKTGVFDVEDLVTLLKSENLADVCVIRIPENLNFGNYMVIASAKSIRHLRAVIGNIRKIVSY